MTDDDPPEVVHQLVEAAQEPGRQPALAAQQRDRLGVLADVDQVRAEVGLPVELAVVQADQRPAQEMVSSEPSDGVARRRRRTAAG